MYISLGDMAQNSHSYFRPNWHAAASSLYCYQLEAFVDMLGSCSSVCLTNQKSQLDLLAEVVEDQTKQFHTSHALRHQHFRRKMGLELSSSQWIFLESEVQWKITELIYTKSKHFFCWMLEVPLISG